MSLNETPETVAWPETHYVFIERTGPFQTNAPLAWQKMHSLVPEIAAKNQITRFLSLYKMGPMVYRAGVALAAPPVELPEGLEYELFRGGNYSRFILTGSFAQLGAATGRAWAIFTESKLPGREDFCIEHYVNNPSLVPEAELITEIMFPVE